ncbi:MAG: hypothetical protein SFU25_07805, partial [Candidatus Caenarcaniphilales bacterium]|nr:hypothetical protein [Candidatus Caenarcaniphilales bacterium]
MRKELSIDQYVLLAIALVVAVTLTVSLSTLALVIAKENSSQKQIHKSVLSKQINSFKTNKPSSEEPTALPLVEEDINLKKEEISQELSKIPKSNLSKSQAKDKDIDEDFFKTIPILGFHDIVDGNNPKENPPNRRSFDIDYSVSKLQKLLEYLVKNDFWFLTSNEFFDYFVESKPIPPELL